MLNGIIIEQKEKRVNLARLRSLAGIISSQEKLIILLVDLYSILLLFNLFYITKTPYNI